MYSLSYTTQQPVQCLKEHLLNTRQHAWLQYNFVSVRKAQGLFTEVLCLNNMFTIITDANNPVINNKFIVQYINKQEVMNP